MKKYLFFLAMTVSVSAMAQTMPIETEAAQNNCELLIEQAEESADKTVYEQCGFNDAVRAFTYWGPYVSSKNYRKALFELAVRHPQHDYAELYIQKSANAGYGPALLKIGHQAYAEGREEQAVSIYKKALQTQMLSEDEQAQIAEKIGLLYLDPKRADFDFKKAMTFIKQAAENGQALSNNILGFYSYSGEQEFQQSDRQALNYFWKAILFDCPAAQENVGVFHLARLKKIDRPTAVGYMRDRLLSCTSPDFAPTTELEKEQRLKFIAERSACDCESVLELSSRLKKQPYLLLKIKDGIAKLADSKKHEYMVHAGQKMLDGTEVLEVRQTAVIINKGGKRFVLNMYPEKCADLCEKPLPTDDDTVKIKPYRLTFTDQECLDLMAYARELIDVERPFYGKAQCAALENKHKDTEEIFDLLNPVSEEESEKNEQVTVMEIEEMLAAEKQPEVSVQPQKRVRVTPEQVQAVKKARIMKELDLNQQKRAKRKIPAQPQKLNPLNK